MSLRGARREQASVAVDARQCLVTIRNGTHFAFPAEIVRGLDRASELRDSGNDKTSVPGTDLMCHFPGIAASGSPGREVLCGYQTAQQAVLVDEIIGLTEVSKDQIRPLPAQFTGPERRWFSGLFLFRDTVALLINPEWLLVQAERLPSDPRPTALPPPTTEAKSPDGTRTGAEVEHPSSSGGLVLDGLALEEATDVEDTPWAEL
jgi:hypothetical protein